MNEPKILTSSWFTPLPESHLRIGISRGVPRGMKAGYRRYIKLNPGPWFNSCRTASEYRNRYYGEVLSRLDPQETIDDILRIADGRTPVLVCFETMTPGSGWCHRALVSMWLADTIELAVPEFGHEHLGYGWNHPKLPPECRKSS